MFDCFNYSDKSAPLTREDAAQLLADGYGFEFFKSPHAGAYHGWYVSPAAGTQGGFDIEFANGEVLNSPVFHATADAMIDAMLKIAPLDEWAVIEETGEPLNVPTYNGVCI